MLLVVGGSAIVVAIAGIGLILRADVQEPARAALRSSGFVSAVAFFSLGLAWPVRAWLGHAQVEWCERQARAIEAYRAVHGEYPPDLDDVPELDPSPWIFRPAYQRLPRDLDKFTFCVSVSPFEDLWWSSRNRTWLSY